MARKIQLANKCYFGTGTVQKFRSKEIKRYMTLIRPIILYRSETWASRTTEVRLDIFERKVPRQIYGPYLEQQTVEWRI